jgi:two-component system, LuxR family, sensor histidine kinase DctS
MEQTIVSVLVVEDSPAQARLLCEYLRTPGYGLSFTVACAARLNEALSYLEAENIDALLLDLSLPDSFGIETVQRVQAKFPQTPIVVLTGSDDEALSMEAIKKGAQDYLVKGQADQKTLIRSLYYAIERKKAEQELRKAGEKLELQVLARTAELQAANEQLKAEISEKFRAEEQLKKRQEALEAIYAIETSFSDTIQSTYDQIVLAISNIVNVPYAAAGEIKKNAFKTVTHVWNGTFTHDMPPSVLSHPVGVLLKTKTVCQFSGDLHEFFPEQINQDGPFSSYIGVPILNKEGIVLGAICAMDTRPRRFLDSEVHLIEIFARYLGHEIEHTLMEESIRSSKEMNMLGLLASGVAHEVRNPLNGILAVSEALFKSLQDNSKYQPYLEHIKEQVRRLSVLMTDLLNLGKPMPRIELPLRSIENVVRGVVDSFHQYSRYKNRIVDVKLHSSSGAWMVRTEPTKIQQAIFNVLENAFDHSPEKAKVYIETVVGEEGFAVIRIVDEGEGVPQELLQKVFEPFFTTRKGGTGLGLSLVKHFVGLHGGTVNLSNNTSGPGCTVEIHLPFVDNGPH